MNGAHRFWRAAGHMLLMLSMPLMLASPGQAQDSAPAASGPASPPPTVTILMLPSRHASVQGAIVTQIAQLSAPQQVEVPAGVTLDAFLRSKCGFYSQRLELAVREDNPEFGAAVATTPRVLALPACPYWEFEKTVAAKFDGLAGAIDVMERHMGYSGPITRHDLLRANKSLKGDLGAVKRGMALLLPHAIAPISFRLRASLPDPNASLLKFISTFPNLVIRAPAGPIHVDLVRDVAPAETIAVDVKCDVDPKTWPFDRAKVESVLRDFASTRPFPVRPITIVVADTGMARTDVTRLRLHDNADERGPAEDNGKDEDGDGSTTIATAPTWIRSAAFRCGPPDTIARRTASRSPAWRLAVCTTMRSNATS